MSLNDVKRQTFTELIPAVQSNDIERILELQNQFVSEAKAEGVEELEASNWFLEAWKQLSALQSGAAKEEPAAAPEPERGEKAVVWTSILLDAGISIGLFFLMYNTQEVKPGASRDWITPLLATLGLVAFPLYKLLYWLLDKARGTLNQAKAWEEAAAQIRENEQWVWHCQRCTATFAYNGESAAKCGRCGNSLTKVRGMRL